MINHKILLPLLLIVFTLTACGTAQTADPDAPSDYSAETPSTSTFEATVIEATEHAILVEPVPGSAERNSADRIDVPLQEDMIFQTGDLVEISYNGDIMESYPAQLGEIHEITLIRSAAETNPSETDPEADTEAPQTEEALEWDRIPMVMVNDKLYYDTGRESTIEMRCGNMDGEITSSVDGTQIPTQNNESNFGSGFGFQYGSEEDTIEIYMNEKWIVFEYREGADK